MQRIAAKGFLVVALLTTNCTASEPTAGAEATSTATSPTTAVTSDPSTNLTTTPESSTTSTTQAIPFDQFEILSFPVPPGSRPHDVAPAKDGGVWYTAQRAGALGHLDPQTGETRHIPLGNGSAPHGVIEGPDGLVWVTDSGLNAIVRVDPAVESGGESDAITLYSLPPGTPNANLNTAVFGTDGRLWFTGQNGFHGVLDPENGQLDVFASPRGRGPYGITATPSGDIYFASLAGSYLGLVDSDGSVVELDPPTPDQGARRVWSDSAGSIWVSEWNSGQLSRYEPSTQEWDVWPLPGANPSAYAVYVDENDQVWVSDFGGNSIHRFDPGSETFDSFALPAHPSDVRQLLGRPGEIWGAESANDSLVVIRIRS